MPTISEKPPTPMMKQYDEIKKKHHDCILFYRLGDFYEMFGDDALEASKILNITLTSRNKKTDNLPMCGVPYHSAHHYLSKLTQAGKKVALCEQVSDPNLPGIVDREVVKIVTPGTTFDERLLDEKSNNFVISIHAQNNYFGLASLDLTTGEFLITEIPGLNNLEAELIRLNPRECIIKSSENTTIPFLKKFPDLFVYPYDTVNDSYEVLTDHFKTKSLEGFGLDKLPFGIRAAGLLLSYLKETQKAELGHIFQAKSYSIDRFMHLDEATLRNLELFQNMRERKRQGTLLDIIDMTITSMGGRLLKQWLLAPLLSPELIKRRLDAVEEITKNQKLRVELSHILKDIRDIERIMGKIGCNNVNARDIVCLRESLRLIPQVKKSLESTSSLLLQEIFTHIQTFDELVSLLDAAIEDEPPLALKEGGIVKLGFNSELDELKRISREGKTYIHSLQQREIDRTGIHSLKVRYNKVFGYYIEVSKANLHLIPPDYIRKQTLVNAERFITPELKEYEEKVLHAEEKMIELEYKLFCEVRDKTAGHSKSIQKTAHKLAELDALLCFAQGALKYNYVKPELVNEDKLEILNGRHPVLEGVVDEGSFVPNDVSLDANTNFILITGPNMAGKSTYLRQAALIILLAQIGSFVPAQSCHFSLVDRIFTRVGAADNLIRGQSTFMVEMHEAAYILNHATEKSLIILDEIGRGTSTYDGVSIAWAIMEYIHDRLKSKTLFATHYHELIEVAEKLERAKNFHVEVRENAEEGVVFLHKVLPGASDKSYGIEVAKLAGLPRDIVVKAQHILKELEEGIVEKGIQSRLNDARHRIPENQLNLFSISPENHPVFEELKKLEIERLTPLQALNKLEELKKTV